ncbi:hypothetical protein WNE01_05290 [Pseudoalteromonas sp. YIC-468]
MMVKISGWLFIGSAIAFAGAGYLGEMLGLYVVAVVFLVIGVIQIIRPVQDS